MSTGSIGKQGAARSQEASGQSAANGKKVRSRRVYTHTMTEREKWALQIVLKAKAACTQLAIAIQEGKSVSPQVVARCSDLQTAAGEMIFAE